MKNILITGGAGFIGSHVVRHFVKKYPEYKIFNYDALTYAGNLASLADVASAANYQFIKGDICDEPTVKDVFERHAINAVIHLAAESHVDKSILNPEAFIRTNVLGTGVLLNAARKYWEKGKGLFYHVSTDEVFGSLGATGFFTETTPYDPRSPYSASKAASDHLVRAYGHTYDIPYLISNCSNNYGAYQFPEKLIPLMIQNSIDNKPLPVYGKGENVRDWLWVEDHVAAIDLIFHKAEPNQTFAIGGENEWRNIDIVLLLCEIMDRKLNRAEGETAKLITYVTDRPGHDLRYAIDPTKLKGTLGFTPSITFEDGLATTVEWYLANTAWVEGVRTGAYQQYYDTQYGKRIRDASA